MESQATNRLVIRIKLPSQTPEAPPARQPLSKLKLAAVLVPIAIALAAWGISAFRAEPDSQAQSAPAIPAPSTAAPVVRNEPPPQPAPEVPDALPSPIDEVLPAVSRGALNTVRGTIRVTIRVTLDPSGAVIAATEMESGPSRYFARHSMDAAKKWTFTPARSAGERSMLVRFYFKRSGVTAGAVSPQDAR